MTLEVSYEEAASFIHWRCAECRGLWNEEYFYRLAENALPVRSADEILDVKCPGCGGSNFAPRCEPSCCSWHGCRDCKKSFFLRLHLEQIGTILQPGFRGTVRFETSPYRYRDAGEEPGFVMLGQQDEQRRCWCTGEQNKEERATFGYYPGLRDERFRFGWLCSKCGRVTFEYRMPFGSSNFSDGLDLFPRDRQMFHREYQAALYCPECKSYEFRNGPGSSTVSCLACHSVFRLEIEPASGPDANWDSE